MNRTVIANIVPNYNAALQTDGLFSLECSKVFANDWFDFKLNWITSRLIEPCSYWDCIDVYDTHPTLGQDIHNICRVHKLTVGNKLFNMEFTQD